MKYQVVKTYGNSTGHSCAFRQYKATSHCRLIHGYALGFEITFESETLDERNWVIDFGDLGVLKGYLKDTFDHTTVVSIDDPEIESFRELESKGLIRLIEMPHVGCEAFSREVYDFCVDMFQDDRVRVKSVKVFEHGSNAAVYGDM